MSDINNRRKSLRKKYAEEGCLNAAFTLNGWFLKIKPAYDIDKIIFCFVQKGTSGKNSFNVYLDVDIFDLWMEDVSNFRMKKIIETEHNNGEKYPKEYKAVTGENGSFTVGICASDKTSGMFVINGSGKHKENGTFTGNILRAFVPVDYNWLRITSKYYKRTCENHFSEISNIIVNESKKQHNPEQGVILDDTYPNSTLADNISSSSSTAISPTDKQNTNKETTRNSSIVPENAATKRKNTSEKKPAVENKNTKNTSKNTDDSNNVNANPMSVPSIVYKDKESSQMDIYTTTKIVSDGSHWKLQALDEKGSTHNIIVTADVATNLGDKFTRLKNACENTFKAKNHTFLSILYKNGTFNNYNVLFLTGINEF